MPLSRLAPLTRCTAPAAAPLALVRRAALAAAPLALLLALVLALPPAAAQPPDSAEVARGVVWAQPDDLRQALLDLRAMRDAGVTAVRTGPVAQGAVLGAADRHGLALYQDLGVQSLPARRLLDTLAFARRELEAALRRAEGHPSARWFGLARFADTSSPRACAYFDALTEVAHAAGARTYYLSRFVEDDVCAGSVDLVLLDARRADPLALLARWRAAHETPAGLAIGALVDDGAEGGYLVPRSPTAQARALEGHLRALLGLEPAPAAVFVHAWRDGADARFGLLRPDDTARPAFNVVSGFYTGRQRVFAFDAGTAPAAREDAPTFVLIGWAVALLLALLLVLEPRFRHLAPRYFTRHVTYREALQRGRAVETWANAGVAAAVTLSAGVVGAVVLHVGRRTDVFEALVSPLTAEAEGTLRDLIGQPWAVVLLLGVAYGLYLLLNMVWLLALTGRRHRLRPAQALTLAAWSRWALLALMVAALLVAVQPTGAVRGLPLLLGAWALIEAVAGLRMLYDFARVTRVPMPRAILVGAGVPLLLLTALLIFAATRPEVAFLWNLATKQ